MYQTVKLYLSIIIKGVGGKEKGRGEGTGRKKEGIGGKEKGRGGREGKGRYIK